AAVFRSGCRRGDATRARSRLRRGDRGDAGGWRSNGDPHLAVCIGGHTRQQDRSRLCRGRHDARDTVPALPRRHPDGHLAVDERCRAVDRRSIRKGEEAALTTFDTPGRYDITTRSSGLARRRKIEKAVAGLAILSALLACAMLFIVLGSVLSKGLSQLDLSFFTKPKPLFGQKGGIADALVGTGLIVAMAIVFAVPLAVLVAVYVSEYAGPRAAQFFRLVLDVLNGVPAIVVGIFVYGILVLAHGQSAIFAGVALAILMLHMVSRATH